MRTTLRLPTRILVALFAAAIALSAVSAGAQQRQGRRGVTKIATTPTALPSLPGDIESRAFAVNNRGVVAGVSYGVSAGNFFGTAVAWSTDSDVVALLPLPGDAESFANAINNLGQAVGYSRSRQGACGNFGADTGMLWDLNNGTSTTLRPLPGDVESRAFGINNSGVMVGTSLGPRQAAPNCSAFFSAVTWDRNGNPTPLRPAASGAQSFGVAINEAGRMAGGDLPGFLFERTLVWDKDGNPSPLEGAPGSFAFNAWAMNNSGLVTGDHIDASFSWTGALWNRKGKVDILAPLAGDNLSHGRAINGRGTVVGFSEAPFQSGIGSVDSAVLWGRDGTPVHLPQLPGDAESQALGINDRGEVVGFSQADRNGGFAWTAVIWR